jgi:hypothetical protein
LNHRPQPDAKATRSLQVVKPFIAPTFLHRLLDPTLLSQFLKILVVLADYGVNCGFAQPTENALPSLMLATAHHSTAKRQSAEKARRLPFMSL